MQRGTQSALENLEPRFLLALAGGDFDGDGHEDLVISAPFENLLVVSDSLNFAGVVHVLYGTPSGATAERNQVWQFTTPGIDGDPAAGDHLGNTLAIGDFDSDGFDDLAMGVDSRTVNGQTQAGAVLILYGSKSGLTAERDRLITQDSSGVPGSAEMRDFFGVSMTSGDFDGDGFDDLAVGAPNESIGDVIGAGAVNVFYGSGKGLKTKGSEVWHENSPGVSGNAGTEDFLGSSLAAGDFDGNGRDDLVIGSSTGPVGDVPEAGFVRILYGKKSGLSGAGDQLFTQNSTGVDGNPEEFDLFARALTVGDFDGDNFDDLAVAAPGEAFGQSFAARGIVHLFFGTDDSLEARGDAITVDDLPGVPEMALLLGYGMTCGNFNGDDFDDLAIGVPFAEVNNALNAGLVAVAYGSNTGPRASDAQIWTQEDLGEESELSDSFGSDLGVADLQGVERDVLLISVPDESTEGFDAIDRHGGAHVVYSTSTQGLVGQGSQFWTQDSPGIPGLDEERDNIGASADFDSVSS